jgi:peptidoglycan/LPS O-acetylase OafA/YrhL
MRYSNFDTMRLAAAVAVIVSHSFPLSYGVGYPEPLHDISNSQTSLGGLAVIVFFILSGYLITASFRHRTPVLFLTSRALRLLPGLAVVLLVLAFVAGPILTVLPFREYLISTAPYAYVAQNLSLTGFMDALPGVFGTNPFPNAIDGSLWTLRYEAECYLILFVLGMTKLLNRYVLLALFIVVLLCSWRWWLVGDRLFFYKYFLGGALFYAWRPPLRWWVALVCALLVGLSLRTGFRLVSATAGTYLTLYIGLAPAIRLPKVTRWGDLSYGTYIWAWPVQQIVAMLLGGWTAWYLNLLIALPIIMVLAALSWHFVERPALSLKARNRPIARETATPVAHRPSSNPLS